MSSMLGSQGVVLATAMAVSGTFLLLAFRLQKPSDHDRISQSSPQILRSCISSEEKKKRKNKKKRVRFAEDVVDPVGDGAEFRKQRNMSTSNSSASSSNSSSSLSFKKTSGGAQKYKGMPANRVALYNGMLRDRVGSRLACSH